MLPKMREEILKKLDVMSRLLNGYGVSDLSQNIWSGYISGPARPIMSSINGPPHLCCHKWSGQNINGPGGQTMSK